MLTLYGIPQSSNVILPLSRNTVGLLGELTTASMLQRYGFDAYKPTAAKSGDLVAQTRETKQRRMIEVKTSLRGKRSTFQFCLYRKVGGRVCTDHSYSDFVVLLCVENDYSVVGFMIPAAELTAKKIEFADPFNCKYSKYMIWH